MRCSHQHPNEAVTKQIRATARRGKAQRQALLDFICLIIPQESRFVNIILYSSRRWGKNVTVCCRGDHWSPVTNTTDQPIRANKQVNCFAINLVAPTGTPKLHIHPTAVGEPKPTHTSFVQCGIISQSQNVVCRYTEEFAVRYYVSVLHMGVPRFKSWYCSLSLV